MPIGQNRTNIELHATDKTGRAFQSVKNNLHGLSKTGAGVSRMFAGLGLSFGAAMMVRDIASVNIEFEKLSREVNSLMNLGEKDFAKFQDELREVSAIVGVDLLNVTKAAYQAFSAGIPKENLLDFLTTSSKTAIAGVTDTKTAVTALVSASENFGISAARASDILFSTVKGGITTFEELSAAMYIAAPTAGELGLSFEELAAATATLTTKTVPTNQAMTQIRSTLTALQTPTAEMMVLFKALGVENGRALLKTKGYKGSLDALRRAAADSNIELAKVFSRVEAQNAIFGLTGDNAEKFGQKLTAAFESAGDTAAAFEENNQTLARSLERVKSSWQSLITAMNENTGPASTGLDGLAGLMAAGAAKLSSEEVRLRFELNKLEQLAAEKRNVFKDFFLGGEKAELYKLGKIWFELGESPTTYAEAIAVIQKRLDELKPAQDAATASAEKQAAATDKLAESTKTLADIKKEIDRIVQTPELEKLTTEIAGASEAAQAAFASGNLSEYEKFLERAAKAQARLNGEIDKTNKGILEFISGLPVLSDPTAEATDALEAMLDAVKDRISDRQKKTLSDYLPQDAEVKNAQPITANQQRAIDRENRLAGQGVQFSKYYNFLNPENDPANPKTSPPLAIPEGIAAPGASSPSNGTTAAAEAVRTDVDESVQSIKNIADSISKLATELETAKQQIQNAR